MLRLIALFTLAVVAALVPAPLLAQEPPAPPPPPLTGSLTAGLALTAGNKDTSTLNLGYEVKYDPKTRNVFLSTGLLLRGESDGDLTAEQYALTGRDEYALNPKSFVFGELRYLHDKFKAISYLLAPTAGVGRKLVDLPATTFAVSGGLGGVWEKNPERDVRASGAVTAEEKLMHKLSPTATLTQSVTALWKTSDFGDALYTFGVGVAASLTTHAQLKVELLDSYKNQPPDPSIGKNDVALIVGVVYKR